MNLSKFSLRRSIFSRLVLTFLIIMIPIYLLAFYIYNWGLNTVKNEIAKSTVAQVSFYLEGLEKELESMKILQYDCLNDEYLNKLAIRWEIMNIYEINESIRQLKQRLETIKNSSVYIKNVSAHIYPIQKTISANTGLEPFDNEKYEKLRVPKGVKGAQIISYKDGLYISTLQESLLLREKPLYLIEIELNRETFEQALAQFNTYEGSGSILISHTGGNLITNQAAAPQIAPLQSLLKNLDYGADSGTGYLKIGPTGYFVVHAKSSYLDMILLKYIPQEHVMKPIKNFNYWVWIFSVVVVLIILVYSLSTYKFMHKPLQELIKSFRKVENGDLQVAISHDLNDEFGYLYKRFNDMVRNLKNLIDQVYNQKILMQRAELKHLQSQINPHFLYNSLFMLNTMARVGDDNLIPFTRHLGQYFRFVTRNSSDFISLDEEVKHAEVYTNIQLMRFSKRLEIRFEPCPEKYRELTVPRLILQPIIENAFEHGIEKKKSNGWVSVRFEEGGNGPGMAELAIVVEDNGSEMEDVRLNALQKALVQSGGEAEITGIINIHRRLRLVFGEKSGLYVSRSEWGGLKVVLKIIVPGGNGNVSLAHC